MVPVSYGAGKERIKQDRVIGVVLVLIRECIEQLQTWRADSDWTVVSQCCQL